MQQSKREGQAYTLAVGAAVVLLAVLLHALPLPGHVQAAKAFNQELGLLGGGDRTLISSSVFFQVRRGLLKLVGELGQGVHQERVEASKVVRIG